MAPIIAGRAHRRGRGRGRGADAFSAQLGGHPLRRPPARAVAPREPGGRPPVADRRSAGCDAAREDGRVAAASPARRPAAAEPASPAEIADDRGYLSAPLDPRFTFENFVVGKPNELAHAAARRVAEACASPVHTVPFNPLFLYGGVGLGKTHLMHAIAWHVRMNAPRRKVIYLSAEKFMYQFIRALRFRSTMDFKEQFRSVDLLMIDDVQFISGKEFDAGGILPYLQRAGRSEPADRHFRRQIAVRSRRPRGTHALAARLGAGRRHPPDDLRAAPRHPAVEGRADRAAPAAKGDGVSRPQDRLERPRARRARSTASPRRCSWSAATSRSKARRRCCTTCCGPTSGG